MAAERVDAYSDFYWTARLQWGRSRMAAESEAGPREAEAEEAASMGPQPNGCGKPSRSSTARQRARSFNGAAAEWLRKGNAIPRWASVVVMLQWGRSRMAAERSPARTSPARTRSFNGAAAEWLRKGGWPATSPWRPRRRFNGAAAEWLRKGDGASPNAGAFFMLQWGRSRMAAERQRRRAAALERGVASMGPQPNGCGKW